MMTRLCRTMLTGSAVFQPLPLTFDVYDAVYTSTLDGNAHATDDNRPTSGNAGPPHPQDAQLGSGARIRHRPLDRAAHGERVTDWRRFAIPLPAPARGARVGDQRMAA